MNGKYKPGKKRAYTIDMKSTGHTLFLLVLMASSPVLATEVYHWVDENGVSHYTQNAPSPDVTGVSSMTLEDTTPPDYDPEEDRYGVQAQAERMAALREEMAQKREAERERQRNTPRQQLIQYQQPYNYGYSSFLRPPLYPVPPIRPQPPIEVPYETVTLRPPGSGSN